MENLDHGLKESEQDKKIICGIVVVVTWKGKGRKNEGVSGNLVCVMERMAE